MLVHVDRLLVAHAHEQVDEVAANAVQMIDHRSDQSIKSLERVAVDLELLHERAGDAEPAVGLRDGHRRHVPVPVDALLALRLAKYCKVGSKDWRWKSDLPAELLRFIFLFSNGSFN